MKLTTSVRNDTTVVAVEGELQFETAMDFRTAITEVIGTSNSPRIDVDLGHTTYLDSSGLGVLLTARDMARKKSMDMVLCGCRGSVREVLSVARFDRLFTIKS